MSWQSVDLGSLCAVQGGGTPSRAKSANFGGAIPWVKIGDMKAGLIRRTEESISGEGLSNSAAKLHPAGTLLLSIFGTIGRTAVLDISAATNQAIVGIYPRFSGQLDMSYLRRYLDSAVEKLQQISRGVAQSNLNLEILRALKVPLPPLPEQRRIAAILDQADELRTKRHHALTLLDELADSLFIHTFGDPANKASWIQEGKISDLLESASYGTSEKAGTEGEFPVLRMGNLTSNGRLDLSNMKFMELASGDHAKYLVKAGDVLFNRTNSADLVGKTALYRDATPRAYAGYLVRLRPNKSNTGEYLASFLNTKYAKKILRGMAKSIVGMANINAREVQTIAIPLFPLERQITFSEQKQILELRRHEVISQLSFLDELFASLQHRAFRGEL
jgi:type I restriction enzyme S subunit